VSQPLELTGRWARLAADNSWSDTVELFADGRVQGWSATAKLDTVRWAVVHSRFGDALCAGPRSKPNCQPFRLESDTLVLGRAPQPSYFRRAR
jgi:hypothetical protein